MPNNLDAIMEYRSADFHAGRINCAETVLLVLSEYYGWDTDLIPRIATCFGGGVLGCQDSICGALSGGLMGIGCLMGRDVGGDRAPAVEAGLKLKAFINERNGSFLCAEILDHMSLTDPSFRAPGGKHQTVCEPLAEAVCRYLTDAYPRKSGA